MSHIDPSWPTDACEREIIAYRKIRGVQYRLDSSAPADLCDCPTSIRDGGGRCIVCRKKRPPCYAGAK